MNHSTNIVLYNTLTITTLGILSYWKEYVSWIQTKSVTLFKVLFVCCSVFILCVGHALCWVIYYKLCNCFHSWLIEGHLYNWLIHSADHNWLIHPTNIASWSTPSIQVADTLSWCSHLSRKIKTFQSPLCYIQLSLQQLWPFPTTSLSFRSVPSFPSPRSLLLV